jgi:hypothetical protein
VRGGREGNRREGEEEGEEVAKRGASHMRDSQS